MASELSSTKESVSEKKEVKSSSQNANGKDNDDDGELQGKTLGYLCSLDDISPIGAL